MKYGNTQRWVGPLVLVLSVLPVSGCTKIPPEHVKMTIYMPRSSEADELDVIVNNNKVDAAKHDEAVLVSFPSMPNGNNTIQFVRARTRSSSNKHEFFATPGAELKVTVVYTCKLFTKDIFDVDIRTVKTGEMIASIEGANIEPEIIRREAHNEVVTGPPGTKYTLSRKRTIERQIMLSESAKLELSVSASAGFGLVEATAKIKATLSQKDTVLMRDKEEINQSVEVVFDSSGTAALQWIDYIKKGKALYKFNGKTKELEFEVLYSSELTILRK